MDDGRGEILDRVVLEVERVPLRVCAVRLRDLCA